VHPFWQVSLTALSMPPEPALDAFIKAYKLAPVDANPRASIASQSAVSVQQGLRLLRACVCVCVCLCVPVCGACVHVHVCI